MVLRNIYFPRALGASGVQGFFGDPFHPEYRHSKFIKFFWGDIFKDMGFVAKTATAEYNKGNVRLNGFAFRHFLPDAIYPMPLKAAALNAVGLSNPGFESLLWHGLWQFRKDNFMLSFMAISKSRKERMNETERFVKILEPRIPKFMGKFALQVNLSCPNTGHDQNELVGESAEMFDILSVLGVPLIPKINALITPEKANKIMEHKECDALCFSNTIPFGELPEIIDWRKYSGKNGKSPIENRGYKVKGGLSGKPIFPVVYNWLKLFNDQYPNSKPVIAGGGITTKGDVRRLSELGCVDAISVGTVAFTRPWAVQGIIKEINNCLIED